MAYAVPLAKEKHGILYNRRALPVNGQRPLAILRCAAGTACVCSAFVLQEVPHIEYLRRKNVGKLHKLRDEAAAAVDRDPRRAEQRLLLRQTDRTVLDIAGQFGYDNGSKFAKAFRDTVGMSPTEYRNAG